MQTIPEDTFTAKHSNITSTNSMWRICTRLQNWPPSDLSVDDWLRFYVILWSSKWKVVKVFFFSLTSEGQPAATTGSVSESRMHTVNIYCHQSSTFYTSLLIRPLHGSITWIIWSWKPNSFWLCITFWSDSAIQLSFSLTFSSQWLLSSRTRCIYHSPAVVVCETILINRKNSGAVNTHMEEKPTEHLCMKAVRDHGNTQVWIRFHALYLTSILKTLFCSEPPPPILLARNTNEHETSSSNKCANTTPMQIFLFVFLQCSYLRLLDRAHKRLHTRASFRTWSTMDTRQTSWHRLHDSETGRQVNNNHHKNINNKRSKSQHAETATVLTSWKRIQREIGMEKEKPILKLNTVGTFCHTQGVRNCY